MMLKNLVEQDLASLGDWLRANKLTVNVEKSVCLVFNEKKGTNIDMKLEMTGKVIPTQEATKFLGVWIDKNLK